MGKRRFFARSQIDASPEEVYAWHLRPGALQRLLPPWERVEVLGAPRGIEDGARVVLRVTRGPFRNRWVARHDGFVEGRQFRDVQESGPFDQWRHTHRFDPAPGGVTCLEDRIEYTIPGGVFGAAAAGFVRRGLERMFRYRHAVTASDVVRGLATRTRGEMQIAVTGASGLVGTALTAFLSTAGHRVRPVVRREARDPGEIGWDPEAGRTDPADWRGVDAVVNLAGESIASGRWSAARKERIRDSRVRGTRLLAETIEAMDAPPRVLVNASAIGFYGDRGDEVVDETSARGQGFLADVCEEWEEATRPAVEAGVRVVLPRIGVVLSARGGALRKTLLPFRLGLGGRLGPGTQWWSWIHLDDLVGVVARALHDERLEGPVNAVAPEPVTNADFTRVLGRVLRRPTLLPAPAPVLRLAAGEVADALLLSSTAVRPARLLEAEFEFLHADLEQALRFELGRNPRLPTTFEKGSE
jgi:uncharacterized protein (TIGR01777 family)